MFQPSWGKKVETGATLMFLDECGFSVKTSVVKTWAPRGETPLVPTRASWDKRSTIGAIATSGQFLQHTHSGAITAMRVVAFLKHVLAHVKGEVVVVLDNAGIHKAKVVKAFVETRARLSLVFLPPYAPELNPIEKVWGYVKKQVLGNFCARELVELKGRLRLAWQRVRYVHLPGRLLHPYLPSPT